MAIALNAIVVFLSLFIDYIFVQQAFYACVKRFGQGVQFNIGDGAGEVLDS